MAVEMGTGKWYEWPFGGIFDDEEGGIKSLSTLSPEQQQLMVGIGQYLQSQMGKGATPYTGQLTAPLSTGEQAAYDKSMSNLGGGLSTSAAAAVEAQKKALSGLSEQDVYNQYMKYTAPSEGKYLRETSIPTFKESMVPGGTLRSTGTETGIGNMISQFGADQLSRIGQRIQSERTNAITALGQATPINALEKQTADIGMAGEMGGIVRGVEQLELTNKLQEFIRTTPEMSPLIDKMLAYLNVGTTAAYAPATESASPFMQLLPAIAQGVGSYYGAKA